MTDAQSWLFDLLAAHSTGGTVPAIGLDVQPMAVYDAVGEIVSENAESRDNLQQVAESISRSKAVLSASSLDEACKQLRDLHGFHPTTGKAPVGGQFEVTRRPRCSLITAISLHQHYGEFSVGAELMFRLGTAAPCYPASWRVKTNPLRPSSSRTALPFESIPATLWPEFITLGSRDLDDAHGLNSPIGRAFAAVALAKFGSTRTWRQIATNLMLPSAVARAGGTHWRKISEAGLWRTYVKSLEEAFESLHTTPPPINYQLRRATAQPDRIVSIAAHVFADYNPAINLAEKLRYATVLWATHTSCDHTLGPPKFRPNRKSHAEKPPETAIATGESERLAVFEDAIATGSRMLGRPDEEPIVWRPP